MVGEMYGPFIGLLHHSPMSCSLKPSIARINYVIWFVVWACSPVLVPLTAFFVYVMLGNELTVSTAFTVSILIAVCGCSPL